MARVKGGLGAKKRHNRTLKLAKKERDNSVSYGSLVSMQQQE